jgi:hypothetical protein
MPGSDVRKMEIPLADAVRAEHDLTQQYQPLLLLVMAVLTVPTARFVDVRYRTDRQTSA